MSREFDTMHLRKIIGNWMDSFASKKNIEFLYWDDLYDAIKAFIEYTIHEIQISKSSVLSDEVAVDHLIRSGWMQQHDRAMSFDSLTAIINNLMRDENKTISVNVYPWKEDAE